MVPTIAARCDADEMCQYQLSHAYTKRGIVHSSGQGCFTRKPESLETDLTHAYPRPINKK